MKGKNCMIVFNSYRIPRLMKKFVFVVTPLLFLLFSSNLVAGENDAESVQSFLSGIKLAGGISAGYFYASNPGVDVSDDEFMLSNFLIELSSTNEELPIGFTGAFGQTSTHSILGTPEQNDDYDIEYASLTLKPSNGIGLEMGLLEPNSGFENTYTYNNKNILLGAIASQQPYNAYGARVSYDISSISIWGGYYKDRLDDEEYNSPDYTWEIGVSGSLNDTDFNIYNYYIKGQRNLVGASVERTIGNIDLAFNIDYWKWSEDVESLYEKDSSIGAAFYFCPNFDKFSIPIRLEYINQDKSQLYTESPDTQDIYSATVSPTWHFNDSAYIRAEAAYINGDSAFEDDSGNIKDHRFNLAVELGYLF
jgi:hypothetical protein